MITSKPGQRLVGLFLFLLGGGLTGWSWHTALTEGYYYEYAVAIFPALGTTHAPDEWSHPEDEAEPAAELHLRPRGPAVSRS